MQRTPSSDTVVRFGRGSAFRRELNRRVQPYFQSAGLSLKDVPSMYLKSMVILAWFAMSYVLLVFWARSTWQGFLLAVSLGLSMAGIGFNIQHDGAHKAYSRRKWVNHVAARTLDLLGGSSYVWHWKHNIVHHYYTNIADLDSDIDISPLGRLAPHQSWHRIHRLQHVYLWILYGLMPLKWQFFDDFRDLLLGRVGRYQFPRPNGWTLLGFLTGKTLFGVLAFLVPGLYHPVGVVLVFYSIASFTLGITLSVVFQLAHCVEEADFPGTTSATLDREWSVHQVEATVDFSRDNRFLSWYLGGLNLQIEHHLFPSICHLHYPAISKIVKQACDEFGLRYTTHPTVSSALASHYRWLRRMGCPPVAASAKSKRN